MEHIAFGFEFKAEPNTEGIFTGMASTFGNKDLAGDIIERGAFDRSLKERPASLLKMLWSHDAKQVPIGKWVEARETNEGLYVKGRINLDMESGRDVLSAMKFGSLDALSIGFIANPKKQEFDRETGVRTLKEIQLFEISPVVFPANPQARVETVKSLLEAGQVPGKVDLERALRGELGFSQNGAKALLYGGYSTFAERCAPGGSDAEVIAAMRRAMEALRE